MFIDRRATTSLTPATLRSLRLSKVMTPVAAHPAFEPDLAAYLAKLKSVG
jgi:hypothetical protein